MSGRAVRYTTCLIVSNFLVLLVFVVFLALGFLLLLFILLLVFSFALLTFELLFLLVFLFDRLNLPIQLLLLLLIRNPLCFISVRLTEPLVK
jgi:hypothetical protein